VSAVQSAGGSSADLFGSPASRVSTRRV
jgi:hypothetical protein